MKYSAILNVFTWLFICMVLSSCTVIAGIFKAGMGFGILIVIVVIAILVFIVSRLGKK